MDDGGELVGRDGQLAQRFAVLAQYARAVGQNPRRGVLGLAAKRHRVVEQLADFVDAIRGGYKEKAYKLNSDLMPLFNNCFVESNPIPAKAAMHAMGLIENELRLPLVPAQQSTYDLMVATIRDLGLL